MSDDMALTGPAAGVEWVCSREHGRLHKGASMPTYVILMHWTDQGVRAAADSVTRYRQAKAMFEPAGAIFKGIWWTTGPYDLMAVVEAPDEETLSVSLLQLAGTGNIRTEAYRAFTETEAEQLFNKLR